jgi:DNA-binding NtrC family response regulator
MALLRPVPIGKKLIHEDKSTPILLLISDQQTRGSLWNLLAENDLSPSLMADQKELLHVLKKKPLATVLIDCGAITINGVGIISKIKVACRHSHIIVICDKSHLADNQHRELIKEVLAIGVYACIMAPFKGWEVISLVSYYSQLGKKESHEGMGSKKKKNLL